MLATAAQTSQQSSDIQTLNNHGRSTILTNHQQQPSIMESELKSLQSKIMDLENKLSFTHGDSKHTDLGDELLKSPINLNSHGEEGGTKVF
jgi:hypothetical protein